jgi:hypothetical protein
MLATKYPRLVAVQLDVVHTTFLATHKVPLSARWWRIWSERRRDKGERMLCKVCRCYKPAVSPSGLPVVDLPNSLIRTSELEVLASVCKHITAIFLSIVHTIP